MLDLSGREFLIALALALVMEGLLPFIQPNNWRKMMSIMVRQNDNSIRAIGLISMLLGLGILYVAR